MSLRKLAIVVLVCVLLGQGAGTLYGQAFSVPISDKVVIASITLPNGEIAFVEARDGSMVTIADEDEGYVYSFVLFLEDKKGLQVVPLRVTGGGENIESLGKPRRLRVHVPLMISIKEKDDRKFDFVLEATAIKSGKFPNLRPLPPGSSELSPDELRKRYGKSGEGEATCCVVCGSVTVCATNVKLWCGACTTGGGTRGFQAT